MTVSASPAQVGPDAARRLRPAKRGRMALLAGAAALAAAAVWNNARARRAERDHPPRGRFLEVDGAPSTCRPKIAKGGMLPALRGSGDTADLGPDLEGSSSGSSIVGGGDVFAAEREEVVDLIMSREEPLRLTGGFEPLHLPFASSGRLV